MNIEIRESQRGTGYPGASEPIESDANLPDQNL